MSKQASFNRNVVSTNALAESAFFASRQAWLAGLGAASISREWARHEAGNTVPRAGSQGLGSREKRDSSHRRPRRIVGCDRDFALARRTRNRACHRQPACRDRFLGAAQCQDSCVRRNRRGAEAPQAREEPRGQSARFPDRPQRQARRQKVEVA